MHDTLRADDHEVDRKAAAWIDDAYGAVGYSNTAMHSVPRDEAEAIQLAGFNRLLEERRGQIAVLGKLAEAQEIDRASRLEAVAPLLFTHDIYKSYPVSLLAKQRFDQLGKWLGRLTPYDLREIDTSACDSIDSWLETLRDQSPLDVATSSGTSGTCSFFPKSKKDYRTSTTGLRVQLTQKFGEARKPGDMEEPIHVLTPFYADGYSTVSRLPQYFLEVFCKGDPTLLHTALSFKASADLMWLAGRLRAAQAAGDAERVDVPPPLMARRAEWERIAAEIPAQQSAFIREMIPALAGQRVFALGITGLFYEIARDCGGRGMKAAFAPNSVVAAGGGGKGVVLPDDANEVIAEFFGVERVRGNYGLTEQNFFLVTCEDERLHLPPWVIALLLDPETGQPLPRTGEQTGRAAFFDLTHDGSWGGIVTGDQISVSFEPCRCGRTTLHLSKSIQRFTELQGGDDKISCAAAPSAQAAALDMLTSL